MPYLMFWAFSWVVCSWNQWMQQILGSCEVLHLRISNRTVGHWAAFRANGQVWKAWPMVSVDRDNSCFTGSGNLFLWFCAIWFRLEKKTWKSKHPASLWKLRTFSFLILKRILKHVCKSCCYRCLSLNTWSKHEIHNTKWFLRMGFKKGSVLGLFQITWTTHFWVWQMQSTFKISIEDTSQ